MAFVLGDQFSRANLQPVNHPPLPSLSLSDGSPLTGTAQGLGHACSSGPWVQSSSLHLSLPSLLKKYSLISNGGFTEHHWFLLAFFAKREEEERRKPSGQAWLNVPQYSQSQCVL